MGFLDFLNGIGSIFGELSAVISQFFVFLWSLMSQLFTFLWNNLVAVAQFLVSGFKKIASFLVTLWNGYIKPAIARLAQLYQKLHDKIARIIAPIQKAIQRIQAWYNLHILKYQLGVINLIQRIRMFLTLLKALHVQWAVALDNQLAAIQGKVEQSIEIIRGKLNEISSFFTIVSNPALLVASLTHATWVVGFFDTAMRALTGFGLGHFIGTKGAGTISGAKSAPFSNVTNALRQDTLSHTGPYSDVRRQAQWAWNQMDAELG